MTSATGTYSESELQLEVRGTSTLAVAGPAVALLMILAVAQYSGLALATRQAGGDETSTQLVSTMAATDNDLFNVLLSFHHKLAGSQRDLPEDAARVLMENLWQLYD